MFRNSSAFSTARRKLTVWYLVIWACLIGFFTYLTLDAKQSAYVRVYNVLDEAQPGGKQVKEFNDRFEEFNQRFKERLIFFDVVLLIIGGWLANFLSGKTLAPIATMVEEQITFAADVSHSLRTPLTTMGLELEAFERGQSTRSAKLSRLFSSLREEIYSMTYLTEGLLALVRTGADPLKARFVDVQLKPLAESVIERMRPLAKARGQQLSLGEVDEAVKTVGNSEHILQVMLLLVDNAIKYSGSKTRIQIDLKKAQSFVQFAVKDDGKGIAKKDQQRIFDRYARGKETVRGTGLGLSIAAKIVAAHDGTIRLRSMEGSGSTFTVQLPIREN